MMMNSFASRLLIALLSLGMATVCQASDVTPAPQFQAFLEKTSKGEPIVIAYLGGSITQGATTWPVKGESRGGRPFDYSSYSADADSWRALTYEWLRSNYEQRPGQFRQVNAGVGGTPSLLGAYRLEENVLSENPDLVFLEFAVNDNGKAKLTANNPAEDDSIYRTNASIIQRLREQNPQVAIFMPLSTHRMLEGSRYTNWSEVLDLGLEETRKAAEALRVPYLSLKEAFYGNGVSPEAALYYDGNDSGGNYVHPSPLGHEAYALAVQEALAELFDAGTFAFADEALVIAPYPISPRIISPDELVSYEPGWTSEVPDKPNLPIMAGKPFLVVGASGESLVFTFEGTAIGIWCDAKSKGAMMIELDGVTLGKYTNRIEERGKYSGRFSVLSSGLDGSMPHTLKLTSVSEPDAPVPHILIYGLCVDEG